MESDPLNEVYTIPKIVELYNVTQQAVNDAIKSGRIEAGKQGGTWLLRRADVERYWAHKRKAVASGQ